MNIGQTRQAIRERCDGFFARRWFKFSRKWQAYVREFEGGCHVLHVRLVNSGGRVVLEPGASIRIEEIEDIFNDVVSTDRVTRKVTSTLWPAVASLPGMEGRKEDHRIAGPEDIAHAVEIVRAVAEAAMPFFNDVHTAEDVNRLLNGDPAAAPRWAWDWQLRCTRGLIAAALVDPEALEQAAEMHRSTVARKHREFFLPHYDELVAALRERRGAIA